MTAPTTATSPVTSVSTTGTTTNGSTAATAASPTARQLWSRLRGPGLAILVIIVFGLGYALSRAGEDHGSLDPRSADRHGSRAAAQLLGARGVSVDLVTTTAEAAARTDRNSTLLVTAPDLLTPGQQRRLRQITGQSGRAVLLSPTPASLPILAPQADTAGWSDVQALSPDCGLPAARRPGAADLGGVTYDAVSAGADACYPSGGHATLLRIPRADATGDTVILGAPDILYNDLIDERGNASLALQLLGQHQHLVWYLPSLADASAGGQSSLWGLIPGGWRWGTLQLAIAAAITALWRARRLGPVVAENLPVAVRAAEATEGRARLYRASNARARAAEALRQATRASLAPLVGVASAQAGNPAALVAAVTARVGTAAQHDVPYLLYGAAPADDGALVRLADQLDALERQVRSS